MKGLLFWLRVSPLSNGFQYIYLPSNSTLSLFQTERGLGTRRSTGRFRVSIDPIHFMEFPSYSVHLPEVPGLFRTGRPLSFERTSYMWPLPGNPTVLRVFAISPLSQDSLPSSDSFDDSVHVVVQCRTDLVWGPLHGAVRLPSWTPWSSVVSTPLRQL